MKSTILSKKDAVLLEETVAGFGRIVTFSQLHKVFKKEYDLPETRNRISLLAKTGWLVRIRQGLYVIVTDLSALGTGDVPLHAVSQTLNADSYISFENALQFHGMYDQMLSSMGAVTFKRARHYTVLNTQFNFYHIKKDLYFGLRSEEVGGYQVHIADREKALLDILYFRSDVFHAGLVWEKLSRYKETIDFSRLIKYALNFNLDVIRQSGFFLDKIGVDTALLYRKIKGKTGYSRMTRDAAEFNAKWRLYFESIVVE